jgi:hypothetical protein
MSQPPSTPYIPRKLVRSVPFEAQQTFNCDGSGNPGCLPVLPSGDSLTAVFDVGLKVTDPNQFLGSVVNSPAANPGALSIPFAIGNIVDALWTTSVAGSVDVAYAVDYWCPWRSIVTIGTVPGITDNISGLRVTGRFVKVVLTNTSLAVMTTDFGVYVRSA